MEYSRHIVHLSLACHLLLSLPTHQKNYGLPIHSTDSQRMEAIFTISYHKAENKTSSPYKH